MTQSPEYPATNARPRKRRLAWWCVVLYVAALVASHVWQAKGPQPVPSHPEWMVEVDAGVDTQTQPTPAEHKDVEGSSLPLQRLYVRHWPPAMKPMPEHEPVVLIHGAPGDGAGFEKLARQLSEREIIAPDLPGFGFSSPAPLSASVRANAHVLRQLLDHEHIQRAHIVGWSNGGGTALHFAQIYPDRVASLTLMASIGEQRFEGSGSHAIEHAKYATGLVLLGWLPECVPHFGLLGSHAERTGWLRNFAESDQRLLAPAMDDVGRKGVPTLVLHGQGDILAYVESAYAAHERIAGSELIVMDANHFLPFMQAEETAGILERFFEEHDAPGKATAGTTTVLAPPPGAIERASIAIRGWGWWTHVLLIVAVAIVSPTSAAMLAGLLVGHEAADMFVVACALLLGAGVRTWVLGVRSRRAAATPMARAWAECAARRPFVHGWASALVHGLDAEMIAGISQQEVGAPSRALFYSARVMALLLRTLVSLPASVIAIAVLEVFVAPALGPWPTLILGALACAALHCATALLSTTGWRHAWISLRRACHHEFWPAWIFYAPLVPYAWWQGLRTRGLLTPSACNPAIDHAGGWVGESKDAIMRALGDSPFALQTVLVPDGPEPHQRASRLLDALLAKAIPLPVILKPNAGQRGFGLKLARTEADIRRYFEGVTTPVVAQPYHPGPHECGILWVRRLSYAGDETGFIFSITRKDFPIVKGDGERTLEALILRHPRYRLQWRVFFARHAGRLSWVPAKGEHVRLSVSGNHCQGTLFRDGADLITPELSRVVDGLCSRFGEATGVPGGLDFCRLDVRYESDELLRQGRGFAIVELNGSSAESTNIYDPARGPLWAWSVLCAQWKCLFDLGAWRMSRGAVKITWREWRAMMREHYATRTGSEIAD